jgi:CO/xanthine dehydrogenase Mo-binding subunit
MLKITPTALRFNPLDDPADFDLLDLPSKWTGEHCALRLCEGFKTLRQLPMKGAPAAFAAAFVEIELDLETGKHVIVDYLGVADCGTVIHPSGLETQIKSGAVQGFGVATLERIAYDPQNGLPASVGLYQAKPPTYGDVAQRFRTSAVDLPDPSSPLGTKGIGEPLLGCGASALLCALSEAVGHAFNRTPIVPDMILNHLAGRAQSHGPLQVNCQ